MTCPSCQGLFDVNQEFAPKFPTSGLAASPNVATAERVDGELRITTHIDDDPSWLHGPPYAVAEVVFDENAMPGCFRTEADLRADEEDA